MTKQDKIKEAYGSLWEYVSKHVDEDGWCRTFTFKNRFQTESTSEKWRPICLSDLEKNNGWIKIESEKDLPEENWNYWIMQSDNRISNMKDFFDNKKYFGVKATHYQPIKIPKPPIF
ncbi:hypothetical protein [Chryseobacterium sp. ZHDP1]|uniref:hypothetical protein n=1 Tax=Chryseobacterium sp. ZHDP1 TaxID=2838877 RepID=UPI001BE08844|nr:hypothetical protein [Chryseobacterium sp. ZHDP1]QWA38853.1 hypothetical protein KKI44_01175 [Chryseobacterium sp. ZHDP1]